MTTAPRLSAAGLAAIAGLHCVWATGSPWPLRSRRALTEQVVGRSSQPPSPSACLAVAALLAVAAGLLDGHPRSRPEISRVGSAGVIAVLGLRGVLGLAGRTDLVSPGSTSSAFRSRDRWVYGPTCLALAALATPAVLSRPDRSKELT